MNRQKNVVSYIVTLNLEVPSTCTEFCSTQRKILCKYWSTQRWRLLSLKVAISMKLQAAMVTHSLITLIVQCKPSGFLCDEQVAVYKSMGYCVMITWSPPISLPENTEMNIRALLSQLIALLIQHMPHIFRCCNLTSPPVCLPSCVMHQQFQFCEQLTPWLSWFYLEAEDK